MAIVKNTKEGTVEQVDVWFSVGLVNAQGSYGSSRIRAKPSLDVFEMTVGKAKNYLIFCLWVFPLTNSNCYCIHM